jgi:crossover junction endodeoxyribonuclease RusA
MTLSFSVIGEPGAKGSRRHVGHGITVESSKKVAPWQSAVSWSAVKEMGATPKPMFAAGVPVRLTIEFYLKRPTSGKAAKRKHPTTRPDLDKITRSTLDALTQAQVYHDDAQVVDMTVTKKYLEAGTCVGAFIIVEVEP